LLSATLVARLARWFPARIRATQRGAYRQVANGSVG
jgi:hypothetical protein